MKPSSHWTEIDREKCGRAAAGFTVVELLVAIAILTLIVVAMTQLTSSTGVLTTYNRQHMSVDDEARAVFDRMDADFSAMPLRSDVDYLVDTTGGAGGATAQNPQIGNDLIFFYSQAPAFFSGTNGNTVALIGYRINSSLQLERLAKGLSWDGAPTVSGTYSTGSMIFLAYPTPASLDPIPSPTPTPYPQSTLAGAWPNVTGTNPYSSDPDFQLLGPQTYRLEFSFLLTNGTISSTPYLPPHTCINGFQDVSAIIATIALLDSSSRKKFTNMAQLVSALPYSSPADFTANPPILTAQRWLQAVNSPNFAVNSGLPRAAASQVHVYQRFFYLVH